MRFQFGEWIIEVNIEATKEHYKILQLYFSDVPSYRKYATNQCYRNYTAYCNTMPSEEKYFFNKLGIAPEYSRVLGFRIDKECDFFVQGNYFVIGSFIRKPADTIWNEQPDICIGKFQFTVLHPEWLSPSILGNIPEQSVCIHFRATGIPWLLDEEYKLKYYEFPTNMDINHTTKIKNDLRNVLKNISSNYREMSEKETMDFVRQWFERVVPADKSEEAKKRCFSSPIVNNLLWHAFSFVPCEKESHAVNMYDSLGHNDFVLLMNSEKIGFIVKNGHGLTSNIINAYNDIVITDINFRWTYVHTHESMCGPYFSFL